MPRPTKCRRVSFLPEFTFFKPAGMPLRALEAITLSIEELEALRLKDYEGLEQEEGAKMMGISRPTFRRIVMAARHKIADALLHGKAIRIEGGIFELGPGRFRCGWDGHEWEVPPDHKFSGDVRICPRCQRSNVGGWHGESGWGRWGQGPRWKDDQERALASGDEERNDTQKEM